MTEVTAMFHSTHSLASLRGHVGKSVDTLFDELIHHSWGEHPFRPATDFYETIDSYVLEADCPGMSIENMNIYTEDNLLVVAGERSQKPESDRATVHFEERHYGKFIRKIPLPGDIDPDQIEAKLVDGVLSIVLYKHSARKMR